jgi:hypothetical protein
MSEPLNIVPVAQGLPDDGISVLALSDLDGWTVAEMEDGEWFEISTGDKITVLRWAHLPPEEFPQATPEPTVEATLEAHPLDCTCKVCLAFVNAPNGTLGLDAARAAAPLKRWEQCVKHIEYALQSHDWGAVRLALAEAKKLEGV